MTLPKLLGLLWAYLLIGTSCVNGPTGTKLVSRAPSIISPSTNKATVVIDAGHGGEDSGAIGPSGLKEKDLTLDISLRVKRLIQRVMPKVTIIMTRSTDIAVGLEERIKIANAARGDLFISIHINSSEIKNASGFEVYSLDVASDRHSERLAARENRSLAKTDGGVNFILADLRANDNRQESDQLARYISQGLTSQLAKKIHPAGINDRGYNQALFQVLFVKMPAVLTELFFISNPTEERRLNTPELREFCARGIVAGVKKYLDDRVMRAQNANHSPS